MGGWLAYILNLGVPHLTAGTLSITSTSSTAIGLELATDTGGTPPYANQLQRSLHGEATWSDIGAPQAGATASWTDSTVVAGTTYDYRVAVTDADLTTVYGFAYGGMAPNPGAGGKRPDAVSTYMIRGRIGWRRGR